LSADNAIIALTADNVNMINYLLKILYYGREIQTKIT